MANREMYLDLSKQPRLLPIIYGRVGDGDVQKLTVYISLNDEPKNLTGYIVTFEGMTNGNKTVIMDSDGVSNVENAAGKFVYTFPSAAFGNAGDYERAYFSITETTTKQRSTTANFQIVVLDNADITAEEAETVITEYNRLVDQLNAAYQAALDAYDVEAQAHLTALAADITAEGLRVDQLNGRLDTIQTTITSLEARMEALENGGAITADDIFPYDKTVIQAQDWNTLTANGFYICNLITGANKPTSAAESGFATIVTVNGSVAQEFISTDGKVYSRGKKSAASAWSTWSSGSTDLSNYYTKLQVDAKIDVVSNLLSIHMNDKANPHGVTAAQVKALPLDGIGQSNVSTRTNFTGPLMKDGFNVLNDEENKLYRYRRDSLDLSWTEQKAKDALNAGECKVELFREGNVVIANWRMNVKDNTKFANSMPQSYKFPVGFRPFFDMSGTIYNMPLNTYQYSFAASGDYNYAGIIEASGNDIRWASNRNGNHYVQGSFITKDPFPTAGALDGGTVVITKRAANGSYAEQTYFEGAPSTPMTLDEKY